MRSPRDAEATPMRRGAAGRPASNRRPWPIGPDCRDFRRRDSGDVRLGRQAGRARHVIELPVPCPVDKAFPLVPVEHQDPACLIARHPHQHPVAPGPPLAERKGDLNRAVVVTGPLPGQRGRVDAQFLRCRLDDILPGQGFFATAQ